MLLADDGQRLGAAEAGHRVVRDDEVPLGFAELASQVRGRFDPSREHVIAGSRQRGYERRIILRVFDLQQPQRRHATNGRLHDDLRDSGGQTTLRSGGKKRTPAKVRGQIAVFKG